MVGLRIHAHRKHQGVRHFGVAEVDGDGPKAVLIVVANIAVGDLPVLALTNCDDKSIDTCTISSDYIYISYQSNDLAQPCARSFECVWQAVKNADANESMQSHVQVCACLGEILNCIKRLSLSLLGGAGDERSHLLHVLTSKN